MYDEWEYIYIYLYSRTEEDEIKNCYQSLEDKAHPTQSLSSCPASLLLSVCTHCSPLSCSLRRISSELVHIPFLGSARPSLRSRPTSWCGTFHTYMHSLYNICFFFFFNFLNFFYIHIYMNVFIPINHTDHSPISSLRLSLLHAPAYLATH